MDGYMDKRKAKNTSVHGRAYTSFLDLHFEMQMNVIKSHMKHTK